MSFIKHHEIASVQASSQSILHLGWKQADDDGEGADASTCGRDGNGNCVAQQQPQAVSQSVSQAAFGALFHRQAAAVSAPTFAVKLK